MERAVHSQRDAQQDSAPAALTTQHNMPTALVSNNGDDVQQAEDDEDRGYVVNASGMVHNLPAAKKKKKRSRKPASKRGLGKPTGFEAFHADAPLTPEQFAESKELFNQDIPFVDRVLKAVQRFERTRKLSSERREIFYKYLAYGGVDVGPNMFVGAQNTEDMDKDQLSTAMAQASVSEETKKAIIDPKQQEDIQSTDLTSEGSKLRSVEHLAEYVVDFEGTMRGFLSRHAPALYPFDTKDRVCLVTTTLERFMDYLLQHDVCPEYTTEVLNTRNLCRAAETQLWLCAEAERKLPGDFNIACSTLFGGSYGQHYDGETYWGPSESEGNAFVGLRPEQATQIVDFAVAGAATEYVYARYLDITTGESAGRDFEVVNTIHDHGFEIIRIEQPSQDCRDLYKENTTEFRPVGTVYARFFKNPEAAPEDLTPEERAALASDDSDLYVNHGRDEYVFFIESDPLFSFLRIGMRVEATIHELNCGIWFFDEVLRVLPSFDLWLENELMIGWKESRPLAGALDLKWNRVARNEDEKPDKISVEADTGAEAKQSDVKGIAKINNGVDVGNGGTHRNATSATGNDSNINTELYLDDDGDHPY